MPIPATDLNDLFSAIKQGDYTQTTEILTTHPALLNAQDAKGNTPLIKAAKEDKIGICEWLIKNGADKDLGDKNDSTPLMWATDKGHFTLAMSFVEWGADVNKKNKIGHTALLYLLKGYHFFDSNKATFAKKFLKKLLKKVTDIDACNGLEGPLLVLACNFGHEEEVIELLLEKGANPNGTGEDGSTALHCLSDPEIAKKMIAAHADPNAKNDTGETPLHCAAYFGYTAYCRYLIEDVGVKLETDKEGKSPLHEAANEEIAELLLKHYPTLKVQDRDSLGKQPLHYVRQRAMVDFFVENGAKVDIVDKNGNTPLHTLANNGSGFQNNSTDTCRALLEKNVDPTKENEDGYTFLQQPDITDQRQSRLQAVLDDYRASREENNENNTGSSLATIKPQSYLTPLQMITIVSISFICLIGGILLIARRAAKKQQKKREALGLLMTSHSQDKKQAQKEKKDTSIRV